MRIEGRVSEREGATVTILCRNIDQAILQDQLPLDQRVSLTWEPGMDPPAHDPDWDYGEDPSMVDACLTRAREWVAQAIAIQVKELGGASQIAALTDILEDSIDPVILQRQRGQS